MAITNGGYLSEYDCVRRRQRCRSHPACRDRPARAATFDIQKPHATAAWSAAAADACRAARAAARAAGCRPSAPATTRCACCRCTEQRRATSLRKRLYVAGGPGGVARLNLDEQNGLQLIIEVLRRQRLPPSNDQRRVAKFGYVLVRRAAATSACCLGAAREPCERCEPRPPGDAASSSRDQLHRAERPVRGQRCSTQRSRNADRWRQRDRDRRRLAVHRRHALGHRVEGRRCMLAFPWHDRRPLAIARRRRCSAVNLYDRARQPRLLLRIDSENVQDMVVYGDYLIAATATRAASWSCTASARACATIRDHASAAGQRGPGHAPAHARQPAVRVVRERRPDRARHARAARAARGVRGQRRGDCRRSTTSRIGC